MTRRFTKMTVVLAVVALCCFMFAGMAAAAGQFSFTTESNPIDGSATNYVKADHTYNFDINVTGITAPVEQFTDNRPPYAADNKLVLTFPEGFCTNTNFVGSSSVSVYLTIGGEEYGPIQVMPEIIEDLDEGCGECSVADQVYFTIERQFLPETLANPAYVTAVRIEGFEVVTPLTPGQFELCVTHKKTSCGIDACANLNVVKTVGAIELESVTTPCLYAGGQITICGTMYDTCGNEWDETTWPILVELKKRVVNEEPCDVKVSFNDVKIANEENYGKNCFDADTCIAEGEGSLLWAQVVHVMTDGSGRFCATLNLPTWLNLKNNEQYVIVARTPEVRDERAAFDAPIEWKFGDQPDAKVPAESIEDLAKIPSKHVARGTYTLPLESQQGLYTTNAHAWLKATDARETDPVYYYALKTYDPENPTIDPDYETIYPGNPYFIESPSLGSQIDLGGIYPVDICLKDKFCNPTPNKVTCGAENSPLKVELRAFDCDNPTQIAGKFYSDPEGTQEIVYIEIPGGAYCAPTIYFKATKTGKVTLQETAIFGPTDYHVSTTGQCCLEVNEVGGCLEVKYLVTGEMCTQYNTPGSEIAQDQYYNGMPKAGWPVKISLRYPESTTIRVELLERVGDNMFNILPATPEKPGDSYGTWNLVPKTYGFDENGDLVDGLKQYLSYDADGDFASYGTFEHNTGVPYDQQKSDFFVYFKNVFGGNDYCQLKDFWVKIVDTENNVHQMIQVGSFIPATDMVRILEPQEWQILSTPKVLAGDGDISTLLPITNKVPPYTEVLTYKDNAWVQVTTEQLEPLYAYLLNMRQNYCDPLCVDCGEEKDVYAKYVFARAVDPAYAMPATRLLSKGANLIGPAFNELEINPLAWIGNEIISFEGAEKNLGCFLYEGVCSTCTDCLDCTVPTLGNCEYSPICPDLLFQVDSLAHLTATFCDGCSAIMNYGGDSAFDCRNSKGNLAFFTTAALGGSNVQSWLQDPLFYAFNGDGYLAYLTGSQTMTGSAQLDLVNVFNEELYGE